MEKTISKKRKIAVRNYIGTLKTELTEWPGLLLYKEKLRVLSVYLDEPYIIVDYALKREKGRVLIHYNELEVDDFKFYIVDKMRPFNILPHNL